MKCPSLVAVSLVGFACAEKAIFEVYGELPPVPSMQPRSMARTRGSRAGRTPEDCSFPLEVVIFQDLTSSFEDDIKEMVNTQLDQLFTSIESSHPGSTYALVSLKDKPIYPLGTPEAGDFCQRFDLAPMVYHLSDVKDAYAKMSVNGGGDAPENQFGAIYSALKSGLLGTGRNALATSLLIVATDAPPHFEGDGFNVPELPPFTGQWSYLDQDQICLAEYYPPPQAVRDIMLEQMFYGVFLVFDDGWWNSLPIRSWEWFNSFIGQTSEFVGNLESDSSNFWILLEKAIREIEHIECQLGTTTTTTTAIPTTTTTAASTTPPPTTKSSTTTTKKPTTTKATTTKKPTTKATTTKKPTTTKATSTKKPTTTKTTTTKKPTTTKATTTKTPTTTKATTTKKPTTTKATTTKSPTTTTSKRQWADDHDI